MGKIKAILVILAGLFFVGQVVASPLLSCCDSRQSGHDGVAHDSMSMTPSDMVKGLMHSHESTPSQELAHDVEDTFGSQSYGCEHQCKFCVGVSSIPSIDEEVEGTDNSPLVENLLSNFSSPRSRQENLFRPPIFT